MLHRIDPTVDMVFKLLFGTENNSDLLIGFLNDLLQLPSPIVRVDILNPYTVAEFQGDDYTVVDVKARDDLGRLFQVEVQLQVRPDLVPRILYSWADLYQEQLQAGGDFTALRPTIAIWILKESLLKGVKGWHHRFQLVDPRNGLVLTNHLEIHTVELRKWRRSKATFDTLDDRESWVYFLSDASQWRALPAVLDKPLMRKAMAVLNQISDKKADYYRYQARQNFLREQRTMVVMTEQALAEKEKALAEIEQFRLEKEQMRSEREQFLAQQVEAESRIATLEAQVRALSDAKT